MWKQVVTLISLASAVICADQLTYEQRVTIKVTEIETNKTKVVNIYNGQLLNLQNTQNAINSVVNNLPTAIVNDRLAEAFSTLEVVAALSAVTNEKNCLSDLSTKKSSILSDGTLKSQHLDTCLREPRRVRPFPQRFNFKLVTPTRVIRVKDGWLGATTRDIRSGDRPLGRDDSNLTFNRFSSPTRNQYSLSNGKVHHTVIIHAQKNIKSCTQSLSQTTTTLISQVKANTTNISNSAVTAKSKVQACATTQAFRISDTVFGHCLDIFSNSFATQVNASTDDQNSLPTKISSAATDLLKCEAKTIISAESSLINYLDSLKYCIKDLSNGAFLTGFLPNVTALTESTLTDQITKSTDSDKTLSDARSEAATSLEEVEKELAALNATKSVTLASAIANFTASFATSKTGFDKAIADFTSNKKAANCVNNITNAVASAVNKTAAQYLSCLAAIKSDASSTKLNQLQQANSQNQSKEVEINLQCIAKVDNLNVEEGIVSCRQEAKADIAFDFKTIKLKASNLKQELSVLASEAENCNTIATYLGLKLISKDKLNFENCILKATKTKYTISIS